MAMTVRGKNIEITPALRDYVEKRVGKVTRYFEVLGDITVLLKVEKGRHIVEVTVPLDPRNGMILRGEEATLDMYSSIDLVTDKLEKQIERYKNKLDRSFRKSIRTEEVPLPAGAAGETEEFKVVKTKRFEVRPMDVEEAILQMNLLNHDFYVYRDAVAETVNVVYRRKDGSYAVIESGH